MRGNPSANVVLIIWAAFAFVTWNVVFDRQVYLAATEFTRQQIERHQRGEPVRSLDEEFRPRLRDAAVRASLWGGSVFVAGIVLVSIAERQTTRNEARRARNGE